MLQIIMHHNGDLFIKTPECEHPLHQTLKVTVDKGPPEDDNDAMLYAISEDLLSIVLWFFDLHLAELVEYEYAPEQSKYALNLMRTLLLQQIESMVVDCVTSSFAKYNIRGFSFDESKSVPSN